VLEFARIGAAVVEQLDRSSPCAWIVDLRESEGGNMWPMLAVVAPLLGSDTLGYFEDARQRSTPWGIRDGTPILDGNPVYPQLRNGYLLRTGAPPVAVLTGARTTSSGEAVLIARSPRHASDCALWPRTRLLQDVRGSK
jgi:hypothetical protein